MTLHTTSRWLLAIVIGCSAFAGRSATADQLLVLDRNESKILRYSANGTLLGTVLDDETNLKLPAGLTLSPDSSSLYVSSFDSGQVFKYDYNSATATATNSTLFASGLANPSSIQFSPDGNKIFVSTLGGTSGLVQYNLDGSSAGPPIFATFDNFAFPLYSGMTYGPNDELFVGAFMNATQSAGAVVKLNAAGDALDSFVAPSQALIGASGLMVEANHLYVSGLFTGAIQRFDVTSGGMDPTFGVYSLAYPQALLQAPDGNGFLVGILGDGLNAPSSVARYSYDGSFLGTFISTGSGLTEATAFIAVVPEPATLGMLTLAVAALGFTVRRRRVS